MATVETRRPGPFDARERALLERIAGGAALPLLLADIIRLVESEADHMLCSILLLDDEGCLRHGAGPHLPPAYMARIDGLPIGPQAGSCGTAAFLKTRVVVDDIASHPSWEEYREAALQHGLLACWSNPIFSPAGAVLGTFAMYYSERRVPQPMEIAWVEAATHLAAIAILRDRGEQARREAEARARQSARLYAVASSVSDAIVRVRDPRRLHETACRIAVDHGFARLAWIGRYDRVDDRIVPLARCGADDDYLDLIAQKMRDVSRSRCPAGRALASGACALSHDIARDPDFFWREAAVERGLRSCAVLPIRVADDAAGLFVLYADRPHYFGAEEQRILTAVADNISFAIESAGAQTARQRAAEELRAAGELHAAILSSITDAIVLLDVEPGDRFRFVSVNRAFTDATGLTEAEVVGRLVSDVGTSSWLPPSRLADAVASRRPVHWEATEFPASLVHGEATIVPIRDDNDACIRLVGTFHDVTARRRAEGQRRELEAQLQQAQRLQALGTLAAGIAHDFNNVLAAIAGNARLALDELEPDGAAVACLEEIDKASRRGSALARQILAFGQPDGTQRVEVDLGPVINEAVQLLRTTAPPHVRIVASHAADTPHVLADPTQMHQIVMNLGTNALHALGDAGGRLDITLDRHVVTAGGPDLAAGLYGRLRVRDTGSGMDAATLQRIFEPFFTTKGAGQGHGLGLSVVHGIVKGHRGAVSVRSTVGRGTEFELLVPAAGHEQ